ncbi:DUF411 domain-containing protein [Leptolyngbya sp. NK1-12]|uniref:DUF411 domain-containing protein n=1 Tax=Leptolyngbya sp. NK1-12 TaxID=2547451 RepID=A0AA96WN94_9CYAN|nr:DUF411 domain-containing protein [Leptolyngbya sp. NK1-12]WNZ25626.1 DUF411 domain-containing protein [Leptolyngbya sp. NK1-12]
MIRIKNLVQILILSWITSLLTLATLLWPMQTAVAESEPSAVVYRDPSCHCCGRWIEHLAAAGFQPQSIETDDLESLKQQYGVPDQLSSCHTAIIDGYVIEGHVPIADIQRLLAQRPNLVGITVPGMPIGTPGMESGDQRDSFTVFSFDQQGNQAVFNQYSF